MDAWHRSAFSVIPKWESRFPSKIAGGGGFFAAAVGGS